MAGFSSQSSFFLHRIFTGTPNIYAAAAFGTVLVLFRDDNLGETGANHHKEDMNMRFSGLRVIKEALTGHKGWTPAWRD
ncbi:MAG: hypothetical protein P8P40_13770, partial [Sulfitobacter sp.]|nr:hypothetical protein [Sulfitobacter sp.]